MLLKLNSLFVKFKQNSAQIYTIISANLFLITNVRLGIVNVKCGPLKTVNKFVITLKRNVSVCDVVLIKLQDISTILQSN